MKAKLGNKEYSIQFATKPTLKAHLIQEIMKSQDLDENLESLEDIILGIIPKTLLVGLQMHHNDEFGYDYESNEGYDEQFAKVSDMVCTAIDENEINCMDLFADMQEEMLKNGFLAQTMESIRKAQDQVSDQAQKTTKKASSKTTTKKQN